MFLGIDIGSSSSKAALIDQAGELMGTQVVNIGTGTNGIEVARSSLLNTVGCCEDDILFAVATGYGRILYKKADMQITEISCHAKGVYYYNKKARTIIDIGGQDAKVIRLNAAGNVENFAMNEKCAAGTGRFFEVMARVLGCEIYELSALAVQGAHPVQISSVCTVFAESEVISQLASGASLADVAKGAHQAVAKRVAGLCGRVGIIEETVMTGGVALNSSMRNAMSEELGIGIHTVPAPQLAGAVGAALYAREHYLKSK